MSVRLRRLQAEYNRVAQLFAGHERISIVETYGNPPDRYIIEYRLKGLVEEKGEITERAVHRAQIVLGRNYPNELPRCNMLTPVFHPNIDHLRICTEDIGAAGKTIDQVITFIGEMIAFQTYNVKSPLNGDAARWTIEHLDKLPLERIDLIPKESVRPPTISETTQALSQPQSAHPSAMSAEERAAAPTLYPTAVLERCVNCGQSGVDPHLEVQGALLRRLSGHVRGLRARLLFRTRAPVQCLSKV
ncbi:MAG: ubiquitin-conjugating enzyme E2 [Acidobacteria bacterium]|nr:ubiquitin-conjugating enzyme E2 [Acidobacteriota bacterium]